MLSDTEPEPSSEQRIDNGDASTNLITVSSEEAGKSEITTEVSG